MASEQEITRDILNQLNDNRATNQLPLGIDQLDLMRGKNGGYPRDMYHATHEPIRVTNRDQEAAMSQRGYVRNYIKHAYPKTIFRRNSQTVKQRIGDTKEFEDVAKFTDFVETRVVLSADHEKASLAERAPRGCSAWMTEYAALPPVSDETAGDKDAELMRLRGKVEALEGTPEPQRRSRRGQHAEQD
jgi:hypothetical protein